jgi:hypothetical protein
MTLAALRQIRQETQPGEIGPVSVVHREQQRAPLREVRTPTSTARAARRTSDPRLTRGSARGRARREERLGQSRGAGEQIRAGLRVGGRDHRLEQLPHNSKRQLPLELRAAGAPHRHLVRPRTPTRGDHELGLAYAGGPLDHHQRARTMARRPQRSIDPLELCLALEQRTRL